jgi:hypothetical protein
MKKEVVGILLFIEVYINLICDGCEFTEPIIDLFKSFNINKKKFLRNLVSNL